MFYVIFNPNASKGHAARRENTVRSALQRADCRFELVRTTHPDHARKLAARAAQSDRYTAVVAAGGDGTLNEVVRGLLGSAMPLGLIPLGTGNDFAKMIDLAPNQIDAAVQRLHTAAPRPIDIGTANGRAFINGLGCGFDAQVSVEAMRPTRLHGFAVYLVALLRALAHYQAPLMRLCFADRIVQQRMLLATVGNGRCHGGGFWLTPDAVIDDGLLDLCYCSALRLDQIARHLPKVLRGTHRQMREVGVARVQQIEISAAQPFPVHLDGEVIGTALRHVEVEIRPNAIQLLA